MACGMVLVIVSRHIDLSVGSQIGFIGVFGALAADRHRCRSTAPNDLVARLPRHAGRRRADRPRCRACSSPMPASPPSSSRWAACCSSATPPTRSTTADDRAARRDVPAPRRRPATARSARSGAGSSALVAIAAIVLVGAARPRRRRRRIGVDARRSLATRPAGRRLERCCVIGFVAVMNAYKQPRDRHRHGHSDPGADPDRASRSSCRVVARKHRFGRHVFAMGGSPESAELAGIDTRRLTVAVFVADGPPVRPRLDRHHRAPERRRERHRHDDRAQRHRRRGDRRHLARRRHRHDLWRHRRRADHAEPRERHDPDGRADAAAEDGAGGRADPRGVDRHGLSPEARA